MLVTAHFTLGIHSDDADASISLGGVKVSWTAWVSLAVALLVNARLLPLCLDEERNLTSLWGRQHRAG